VSEEVAGLHLVLGDEELLVERAVAAVLRQARKQAGTDDVPVDRLRAGEVGTSELAELLSPSLFADERVVVLEAAAEAGKDAVALVAAAAADLPPGTMLIVVHSGGGRAKALADQLKNLGAQVHPCARITKAGERADFVRREFRALKVKVSDDTVTAVLDAVGSDIRELAAVCSQLVADTDGTVDALAVRRYHSGKAEVKGFDIADKAVMGDTASPESGHCPGIRTGSPPNWACRRGGCRRRRSRRDGGRAHPSPRRCNSSLRSMPTSRVPRPTPTTRWKRRCERLPSWPRAADG
jgi:DNA polymerase-3 subunit delta